MGHSVTLGGERVGSGNKNKIYLHNYERSTHNLSEKFTSTMGVGMLVPFLCIPATRDDKFEIDLSAGLRTIPTKGPLFGSFKLQLDVYQCPWRLYQALLHNNPLAIGLKANQVKFPKMRLHTSVPAILRDMESTPEFVELKAANNSLVKYLGISGIGCCDSTYEEIFRDMPASHLLAYYDIFKNYYANKQEENAYTLSSEMVTVEKINYDTQNTIVTGLAGALNPTIRTENGGDLKITFNAYNGDISILLSFMDEINDYDFLNMQLTWFYNDTFTTGLIKNLIQESFIRKWNRYSDKQILVIIKGYMGGNLCKGLTFARPWHFENEITLKSFPLKNIDDMRMNLLSFHQLGQSFLLNTFNNLEEPYNSAIGVDDSDIGLWQHNLAGLCVKTYQSDLFNNWINTEWIDGENGIAAITAISTSDGKITIDALNFSEKLYNLLNRIAVSGATYEDYLDAAYTDSAKKFCEAPMWVGGMSDEIVFEEIVQTAPTEDTALGTLGGRGNLLGKKKGGKITIKVDEPSWIIGIVSITPRVQYTQGNMWYNTEIESLQDLHVPALDGIAFQNLMASQLHHAADMINDDGQVTNRPVIGKVPAWINYMTSFDKAYGDFAAEDGDGYMILNRNYEFGSDGELQDATTYIDPAKFNYAFAYTKRDAQNFWVQIHSRIKARRLMSAKQIPNV